METKYLHFMNKKKCSLIKAKSYRHLFIRINGDKLDVSQFSEFGLFKHHLLKTTSMDNFDDGFNPVQELNFNDLKSAFFTKKNGVLWLNLQFNLELLIIAPNSWKDEKYQDFIYKINDISKIEHFKLYEKYLKK